MIREQAITMFLLYITVILLTTVLWLFGIPVYMGLFISSGAMAGVCLIHSAVVRNRTALKESDDG